MHKKKNYTKENIVKNHILFNSLILLLLIALCFSFTNILAQNTTKGKEFWVAFMENINGNGNPAFSLLISSDVNTSGIVSIPATGYSMNFSASAGQVTEIFLPISSVNTVGSEIVETKGIKVTSNDSISLRVHHHKLYFSEASIVLPVTELSDYYMVMAHRDDINANSPSEFVIVATEDNTIIDIIPSVFTIGSHFANNTFTVTLNKGDIYQVQSWFDLTGSIVKAHDKKVIAVFSGAKQADIICSADDHLYEQDYPVSTWGTEFVTIPFASSNGDVIRVLAANNQTKVYFDCSIPKFLDKGEYFDTILNIPVHIESNEPVAIGQFKKGQDCGNLGDATFLLYKPLSYYLKKNVFNALISAVNPNEFSAHYLNLLVQTANINLVFLDGNNISSSFSPVPSFNTYSYAQISLNVGTHTLQCDSGFYGFSYGYGDYDAYSYFLGYSGSRIPSNPLCILGNDTTLCEGEILTLNITIPNATYLWQDNSTNPIYNVTQQGIYWIKVTTNGCSMYDTLNVNYNPLPSISAGNDTTINLGESITLYGSGGNVYSWSPASYLSCTNCQQPIASPLNTTNYILFATDVNGCSSTDSVVVFVEYNYCELFVPSAFSPNGDGNNDILKVYGKCIKSMEFKIYNRWGEKVFESTDPNIGWNGKFRGKELDSDVFVYYLKAEYNTGKINVFKGNVSLMR